MEPAGPRLGSVKIWKTRQKISERFYSVRLPVYRGYIYTLGYTLYVYTEAGLAVVERRPQVSRDDDDRLLHSLD